LNISHINDRYVCVCNLGVLKTEIHPTLPKITVTGNVEVRTLIKKLAKVGKSAELWPNLETPVQEKAEKKSDSAMKEGEKSNAKGKSKENNDGHVQEKTGSNSGHAKKSSKVKNKENQEDDIQGNDKNLNEATNINISVPEETKDNSYHQNVVTAIPQVNCLVNPNLMPPFVQGYYPMQPFNPVAVPYYAMNMNAYSAPPPFSVHDHCHCQSQVNPPPPVQSQPAMGFTDYFNDDNTVGCRVM